MCCALSNETGSVKIKPTRAFPNSVRLLFLFSFILISHYKTFLCYIFKTSRTLPNCGIMRVGTELTDSLTIGEKPSEHGEVMSLEGR